MIPDLLVFHLILGFASGWLIVAGVAYVAGRYGTGWAGFVGAIPSLGAVSLLFIGVSQTKEAAVEATAIFPLTFSITFGFLLFYAFPKSMRFWRRISIALLLWFSLSMLVAFSGLDDFRLSVAGSVLVSLAVFLVYQSRGIVEAERVATDPRFSQIAMRGGLGGCVVVAVITASAFGGPLMGGALGAVPAIWTSSLVAANHDRGLEFSRSLTKSFLRVGLLTIIPYFVATRYLISMVSTGLGSGADVGAGTLLAYVAISPLALLAWRLTSGVRGGEAGGASTPAPA